MRDLRDIIERFSKAKILVIGDLILDEYIWGEVERISPEAPVPVVWAKKRSFSLGGAANVANNLKSLGVEVSITGVVGFDYNANILLKELEKRKINTKGVYREKKRPTTLKTRIIAGHQQVIRVDWEETDKLPLFSAEKIVEFVLKDLNDFDGVIIEDYGKGIISSDLIKKIKPKILEKEKIITVDPKEENFYLYKDVTAITPNKKEAENAIRNIKIRDEDNRLRIYTDKLLTDRDIDLAGVELLKYLNCKGLLITLGERGMRLFEKGKKPKYIDTTALEVYDITGAGDTVISTFTLSLAVGAEMPEASLIANFAAGIVVGKLGTATVSKEELLERISRG